MPDPLKKTISGTQVPGIFNQSPYVTSWMLYHWLRSSLPLDIKVDDRMTWGKKLQHVIIAGAAEKMRLEVRPCDEYRRHKEWESASEYRVGYTTDADVYDPALGIGAVEAKNVDAYVYRKEWSEDTAPPHIELQVQVQIFVLASLYGACNWGIIPVLVGGNELVIHRRAPNMEQQALIRKEVAQFWLDVERGREPDAFGLPREVPGLNYLYAERAPGKIITVSTDQANDIVRDFQYHKEQAAEHKKLCEANRIKIRAMAQDAEYLVVPSYEVKLSTTKVKGGARVVEPHTQTRLNIREVDL